MQQNSLFPVKNADTERPQVRMRKVKLRPQAIGADDFVFTDQDWAFMEALSQCGGGGGVETRHTVLLAYPRSLRDTLNHILQDRRRTDQWLDRYDYAFLWHVCHCLKLLQLCNRLWSLAEIHQPRDLLWWKWLEQCREEQRDAYAELKQAAVTLQRLEAEEVAKHPALMPQIEELETQYHQGNKVGHRLYRLRLRYTQPAARRWIEQVVVGQEIAIPAAFWQRPLYGPDYVSGYAYQRLRVLQNQGVIVGRSIHTQGLDTTVWYLTPAGRRKLAERHGVSVRDINWKAEGGYGTTQIAHRLGQTSLRLALIKCVEQAGGRLIRWLDTLDLEARLQGVKVPLERLQMDADGHEVVREVSHYLKIPDDVCFIQSASGQQRMLIIELDRATMSHFSHKSLNTMELKYRTFGKAAQLQLLSALFPDLFTESCHYWHLTVTTGTQQRLENLYTTAMSTMTVDNMAQDRYWFAQLARVQPTWPNPFRYTMFTDPIWLRGGCAKGQVMELDETHGRR